MIKQLKNIHHRFLVWKMLKKRGSLFGNQIQKPMGIRITELKSSPVNISLAVVVITHNNKEIIEKCIDSLLKYNDYSYEIVVVDNQSNDGTIDFLNQTYKNQVQVISNPVNGCASGRNLGANQTNAKYLMFLDSDQGPVAHGWLNMYLKIINHKNVGAVGWRAGFLTEKDLTGPNLDRFLATPGLIRTNIDYLESGGLMLTRQLFGAIEGFDENYDPHAFEDTDLSRKVVATGKVLAYCPDLPIFHDAHSTTKADLGEAEYLAQFAKNAAYFRKKWGL